jgi:hypothetical protein
LNAAGRLTPLVRELLHQVRVHLSGARDSAARLIDSLRHSGETGRELQLLLQELQRFRTLSAALATTLTREVGPTPMRPALASAGIPYLDQAPAIAPWHAAAVAPEHGARPAAAARATSRAGGASTPPSPWYSALGSASASAGGAFFAAGLAGLAALLIALTPPMLRTRILAPPGRRHNVAFLAVLERPG